MPKNKRRNRDSRQGSQYTNETQNRINQVDGSSDIPDTMPIVKSDELQITSTVSPIKEKESNIEEVKNSSPPDLPREPDNELAENKTEVPSKNKDSLETSQSLQKRSPPANNNSKAPAGQTTASNISAVPKTGLERSLKDLSRQISSLKRIEVRLENEIEGAIKRIKQAFQEARKMLDERELIVDQEMHKAKEDARKLLAQRQEQGASLKVRVDNVSILSEPEITELRADIKHFVVERKYDEELAGNKLSLWSKDIITEAIQNFVEVRPVKNHYSQRSNSVSSSVASAEVPNANGHETPEAVAEEAKPSDQESSLTTSSVRHKRPELGRARVFSNRGRYNANFNGPVGNHSSGGYEQGGAYRRDNGGNRYNRRPQWSQYNSDSRGNQNSSDAYRDGNSRGNQNSSDAYRDGNSRGGRGHNNRYPRRDGYPRGQHNYSRPNRTSNRQQEERGEPNGDLSSNSNPKQEGCPTEE